MNDLVDERKAAMFQKVAVAYNGSPEAERALVSAIRLATIFQADLHTVTAMTDLPAYTAYAGAADVSLPHALEEDRAKSYELLQDKARALARTHGIDLRSHLVQGHGVEAIVDFLCQQKADLLVIGLHQRDFYIARLWSTVYDLAQEAPCSVLGVH
jgi:nucleotide-binding universal stress UspA family protein